MEYAFGLTARNTTPPWIESTSLVDFDNIINIKNCLRTS